MWVPLINALANRLVIVTSKIKLIMSKKARLPHQSKAIEGNRQNFGPYLDFTLFQIMNCLT